MAIMVGEDTYITVAEADRTVAKHLTSDDVQRISWEAVDDADKEIYLRQALFAMERVRYSGKKSSDSQALSFPRVTRGEGQSDVPQDVKDAQVFEALELCCKADDMSIYKAANSGVSSFSLGQLSESYKSYDVNGLEAIIRSKKARQILSGYIGGGYSVL